MLVLANKQDMTTARSYTEVARALQLEEHSGKHDHLWCVQGCSLLYGGDGVLEGMEWLRQKLQERARSTQ